jgi:hypothetical protein
MEQHSVPHGLSSDADLHMPSYMSINRFSGILPTISGRVRASRTCACFRTSHVHHLHRAGCTATALQCRKVSSSNVAACRFPFGLLDIDVSNNSGITGIMPAQMGCDALQGLGTQI